MAYEEFENDRYYDVNHDGHIDSSEEAFIRQSLAKRNSGSTCLDIDDDGDGWYPTEEEYKKHKEEIQAVVDAANRRDAIKFWIKSGIIISLALFMPNKLGAVIISAFVLAFFYLFDSML